MSHAYPCYSWWGVSGIFGFASFLAGYLTVRSLYHFYCILGNTTTIEGWEKDKVATLIRRGKIREVKFPYVRIFLLSLFLKLILEYRMLVLGGTLSQCWAQTPSSGVVQTSVP